MAEETSQTSSDKNWFADINWRTNAILAILSLIAGGFSGAGIVASKAVQAQGLSQDAADVRYLTKDEANRRADLREKQIDDIRRTMVSSAIFDERTNMILRSIELMRQEQKDDRAAMERLISNR